MAKLESKIKIKMELRPCLVSQNSGNGIATPKAALFHKWIDKEEAILKFNAYCNTYIVNRVVMEFREKNTLPKDVDVLKNKRTLGLVEYDDGTVAEVEPTRIKFVDNQIREFAFFEESKINPNCAAPPFRKGSPPPDPKRFYRCPNCGEQFEVYNGDILKEGKK